MVDLRGKTGHDSAGSSLACRWTSLFCADSPSLLVILEKHMSKKKQKSSVPSDAELLTELATLDDVSARIPTSTEHDAQVVPAWCELVLNVMRQSTGHGSAGPGAYPLSTTMCLRRHDGELIIEVLDAVLHPKTDREARGVVTIWAALDAVVDRIQARVAKGKPVRKADIGEARGLSYALAAYLTPREPDTDAVRAEAMERWDARTGGA